MELTGRIRLINETQTFGANGFRKRELVLTTEEQYPQHILVEFIQDKCDLLDQYNPHEKVTVSINVRGREWVNPQGETKFFNSIQGWRIAKAEDNATAPPMPDAPDATPMEMDDNDDLPF